MDVDINGSRRTIALRENGGRWIVLVSGRELEADARRVGDSWSLLLRPCAEDAGTEGGFRSYEVAVEGKGPGELLVHVNGHAFLAAVPQLQRGVRSPGASGARAAAGGARRIVAPMAGRVVKVLVSAGDPVQARQPLVVVEAMKMENELRSPGAGTVASVGVLPGAPVEAGQVLLVLE